MAEIQSIQDKYGNTKQIQMQSIKGDHLNMSGHFGSSQHRDTLKDLNEDVVWNEYYKNKSRLDEITKAAAEYKSNYKNKLND